MNATPLRYTTAPHIYWHAPRANNIILVTQFRAHAARQPHSSWVVARHAFSHLIVAWGHSAHIGIATSRAVALLVTTLSAAGCNTGRPFGAAWQRGVRWVSLSCVSSLPAVPFISAGRSCVFVQLCFRTVVAYGIKRNLRKTCHENRNVGHQRAPCYLQIGQQDRSLYQKLLILGEKYTSM